MSRSSLVYNRDSVPAGDVPRTHLELAELLRREAKTYRGKVGTYDIRMSGIGYLLAFNDARQTTTTYGRLLESLGRAQVVVRCCTSEILDELAAGRLLIGYNMLGSYAARACPARRAARHRHAGGLHAGSPAGARWCPAQQRAAAAARFLDYLLSARGQSVGQAQSFFFGADGTTPGGIEGPNVVTSE